MKREPQFTPIDLQVEADEFRGKRSVPDSIHVNLRCLWQQWMMV